MAVPARRHTPECAASPAACSCNAPALPVARSKRKRRPTAGEAHAARLVAVRRVVEDLLAAVPMTSFAYPEAQRAIREAQALVAELGGPAVSRVDEVTERWLADEKRGGGR